MQTGTVTWETDFSVCAATWLPNTACSDVVHWASPDSLQAAKKSDEQNEE